MFCSRYMMLSLSINMNVLVVSDILFSIATSIAHSYALDICG